MFLENKGRTILEYVRKVNIVSTQVNCYLDDVVKTYNLKISRNSIDYIPVGVMKTFLYNRLRELWKISYGILAMKVHREGFFPV